MRQHRLEQRVPSHAESIAPNCVTGRPVGDVTLYEECDRDAAVEQEFLGQGLHPAFIDQLSHRLVSDLLAARRDDPKSVPFDQ